MAEMELRLSHGSEELARQTELHHSALQRAQLAEQQVQDLRGRLKQLEGELLSADVHRDGLSHGQQHVSTLAAGPWVMMGSRVITPRSKHSMQAAAFGMTNTFTDYCCVKVCKLTLIHDMCCIQHIYCEPLLTQCYFNS